jgi:hypothetical protein
MNLLNLTTNEYPSSLYQVRQENPNVSFPVNPTDEDLAPFGYANVHPTPQPDYNYRTQRIEESPPEPDDNNVYRQTWSIRDATAQEIADYDTSILPPPDWTGFAMEAMVNTEINSMLSAILAQVPGLYGGLTVGLGQAGQGNPHLFISSWGALVNTGMVTPSTMEVFQELSSKYNIRLDLN